MSGPYNEFGRSTEWSNFVQIAVDYRLGKLALDDMSPDNRRLLLKYLKDAEFTKAVEMGVGKYSTGKKGKLFNGEQTPAVTGQDMGGALINKYFPQLSFFPPNSSHTLELGGIVDTERDINRMHKIPENRYSRNKKPRISSREVRHYKVELRKLIGLPMAGKGKLDVKNPKDMWMLREIVDKDPFGIFSEYDRQVGTGQLSPELSEKIFQVASLIEQLKREPNMKKRAIMLQERVGGLK
jgi:hypothetical protein